MEIFLERVLGEKPNLLNFYLIPNGNIYLKLSLFRREEPAQIVDSVYKKCGQFSLDRSSFFKVMSKCPFYA